MEVFEEGWSFIRGRKQYKPKHVSSGIVVLNVKWSLIRGSLDYYLGFINYSFIIEFEKAIYGHFHSLKLLRCVNLCWNKESTKTKLHNIIYLHDYVIQT